MPISDTKPPFRMDLETTGPPRESPRSLAASAFGPIGCRFHHLGVWPGAVCADGTPAKEAAQAPPLPDSAWRITCGSIGHFRPRGGSAKKSASGWLSSWNRLWLTFSPGNGHLQAHGYSGNATGFLIRLLRWRKGAAFLGTN